MTTTIDQTTTARTDASGTPGRRRTAAFLLAGGILTAAGGQLHPVGSGATVDAHLLSMFGNPSWNLSHVLLLVGTALSVVGFGVARRTQAFGPFVQPWLLAAMIGWAFGVIELVPHLLAATEAEAFAHHHDAPVIDVHLVLQVIASPAVGLTGAALAVVVTRSARTWPARILALLAVIGGIGSGLAAPLVIATGDPLWTALFPFQAGLAVWLVGTGVRLLSRPNSRG